MVVSYNGGLLRTFEKTEKIVKNEIAQIALQLNTLGFALSRGFRKLATKFWQENGAK